MFIATFSTGGIILKNLVEVIKDKIPVGTFIVSKDGMILQAMDDCHVSLVDFILYPKAAKFYKCDEIQQICIDFDAMSKILNCSSVNGDLTLKYDKNSPDILTFIFEGTKKSKFQMRLKDIKTEGIEIPEFSHSSENPINSTEFQKILKDFSKFTEDITITISNSMLTYSGIGEITDLKVDMIATESYNGILSQTFSLKYLLWFAKAAVLADHCTLALDETIPLKLEFENEHLRLSFYLAAKVAN